MIIYNIGDIIILIHRVVLSLVQHVVKIFAIALAAFEQQKI